MDYATVKLVHQVAVTLSIGGFVARGAGALADAGWVRSRLARTLPHAVDTVLFGAGLTLAWMLRAAPGMAWLGAKLLGVLAYIVLGWLALRPGLARPRRAAWWLAALAAVAWVVSVAVTKDPWGFLAPAVLTAR